MKTPILCALCLLCGFTRAADAIKTKSTYKEAYGESKAPLAIDPAKDLPRYPAVEPKDAAATWRIKKGFKIELAASEPQVRSPIAICFDERGRMFVCEMIDYSEMRDTTPHLGRVSMIEDRDGDGRYETGTVFADGLPWPTGIIWANGGLYVIATPDIWFFKDTKDTGKADTREKVFTGFGTGLKLLNVQGLANCPQWGPDNRIHIQAGGGNRGVVTCLKRPDLKGVDLGGRDFWFDPRTHEFGLEAGGAQYGMSFDNYGRKFACSNSDHLQFFVYDDRYAARNPYFSMPPARRSIAADGGAAEVFRISPDEPWRIVRTRWRIAGVVKGAVEGGGRVSGYFTGATGTTVYRGDAYGEEFVNNTFTGDAGGQLIHRKKIHPDGVSLVGKRPDDEQGFEFAASTDTWVRVVNFANAPDGCLHVCDMYREVIEHPWSIPDEIKKHLDLNSGKDRGRIWRIVPESAPPGPPSGANPNTAQGAVRTTWKRRPGSAADLGGKSLADMTTAELVKMLEHPNGWHRDTAQRLLCEKQDESAVPLLLQLFDTAPAGSGAGRGPLTGGRLPPPPGVAALAKFHGLGALEGLGAISESVILAGLKDEDPRVVERAIVALERYGVEKPLSDNVARALRDLAIAPDPRVQFQLALTLGALKPHHHPSISSEMWRETLLRLSLQAAHSAALADALANMSISEPFPFHSGSLASDMISWFGDAEQYKSPNDNLVPRLIQVIGAANREESVQSLLKSIDRNGWTAGRVRALAEGLKHSGSTIAKVDKEKKLAAAFAKAADTVRNTKASASSRIDAIQLASLDTPGQAVPTLLSCLDKSTPEAVQTAAIGALGQFSGKEAANAVIEHWPDLRKKAREAALSLFLTRPERALAVLQSMRGSARATGSKHDATGSAGAGFQPASGGMVPPPLVAKDSKHDASSDGQDARPPGIPSSARPQPSDLSASQVQALLKHADKRVSSLAQEMLAAFIPPSRESVIGKFQPALTTKGDPARGQIVFSQRCMACHRANNLGVDVAPPLITVKTKGREGIFTAILDPNKEIAPQYIAYTVNTKDGQTLAGIIANDTANSMTLKIMGGAEINIPRSNIKGSGSTGISLMPEGIEAGMSAQDMADLLDFIESLK